MKTTDALAVIFAIAFALVFSANGAEPEAATHPTTRAASTQPAITLINMHLRKKLPQEVFEELSKQSGVSFEAVNDLWEQESMQNDLDVDLTDRPFWSAMNELCNVCGVMPQMQNYFNGYGVNNGARRITLYPANRGAANKVELPSFERDGFLVQATGFNRQQTINYNAPDNHIEFCSVQLMIYVDPAIHVSSIGNSFPATDAVDDHGHSMLLDPTTGSTSYGGSRQIGLVYPCNISLKYPQSAGKKIASLKFNLVLRGSTTVDKMFVDSPLDAAEVTKDFGDASIVFHSLKKGSRPASYDLKVGAIIDGQDNNRDFYSLFQTAELLDSKGRPFTMFPGGGGGGNGTFEYTITYGTNPNRVGVIGGPVIGRRQGGAVGLPTKWVLELPTHPHSIQIPVELKDLPLP
jgi:hypothetical protein